MRKLKSKRLFFTFAIMSALFFVLSLGLITRVLANTNYFTWNADSIQTSIGPCTLNQAIIDPSEKHSGTASMKFSVPGNVQGGMGCGDVGGEALGSNYDGGWLYYR